MFLRRGLQTSPKIWKPILLKRQAAGCITNGVARLAANYSTSMSGQPKVDAATNDLQGCWFSLRKRYCSPKQHWPKDIEKIHQSVSPSTTDLYFPRTGKLATGTVMSSDGYIITSAHALGYWQTAKGLSNIKVCASLDRRDVSSATILFADYHYGVAIIKLDVEETGYWQVPKFASLTNFQAPQPYVYYGEVQGPGLHDPCHFVAKYCDLIRMEDTLVKQGDIQQELLQFKTLSNSKMAHSFASELWWSKFRDVRCPAPCERNYGGPIVDLSGNVIGVLTTAGSNGYEYAVPSNLIFKIFRHFQKYGRVIRPYVGITFSASDSANWIDSLLNPHGCSTDTPIHSASKAVHIREVVPNSPAHKAGLKEDDIIIQINGQWIRNPYEVTELLWDSTNQIVDFTIVTPESPNEVQRRYVDVVEANSDAIECFSAHTRVVALGISQSSDSSDDDDDDDDCTDDNDDDDDGKEDEDFSNDDHDDHEDECSSNDDHDDHEDEDSECHSSTSSDDDDGGNDDNNQHKSPNEMDAAVHEKIYSDDGRPGDNNLESIMATLLFMERRFHEMAKIIETQLGQKANASTVEKLKWEVSRLKRGL